MTETQQVRIYSHGDNHYGQLGNGTTTNKGLGVPLFPKNKTILFVACGENHSVAYASDKTYYSWGNCGSEGRLGLGTTSRCEIPTEITALRGKTLKKLYVGGYFAFLITDNGEVWCWGEGSQGTLFTGNNNSVLEPKLNTFLTRNGVRTMSLLNATSVVVTRNGDVYYGGDGASRALPRLAGEAEIVESRGLRKHPFYSKQNIVLGTNGMLLHHFLVSATGQIFACGANAAGELAQGHQNALTNYSCIPNLNYFQHGVKKIRCGDGCTFILMKSGELKFAGTQGDLTVTTLATFRPPCIGAGERIIDVGLGFTNACIVSSERTAYVSFDGNPFAMLEPTVNACVLGRAHMLLLDTPFLQMFDDGVDLGPTLFPASSSSKFKSSARSHFMDITVVTSPKL